MKTGKELAKEHAKSVLGESEYKKNKAAAKSIEEDFMAGWSISHKALMKGSAYLAKHRSNYNKMLVALRRINKYYQTPTQLRRNCEKQYGLGYQESLEMAYENIQQEAKDGLRGVKEMPAAPKP